MSISTIRSAFAATAALAWAQGSLALVDASRPQLGWNSYNSFKGGPTAEIVTNATNKLVELGLRDVGYSYVVMDDAWQDGARRDQNGRLLANRTSFPDGIPALADYVHSKGLKIGLYSDAGILTCGFHSGSWGNEEIDAQTFAEWGIDYLKYDNCGLFEAGIDSPFDRYSRMKYALLHSGRDIFYSMCQWGNQFPWFWAHHVGHSYRMSGDIHNAFNSDNGGMCKTAYCLNTGYAGCSVTTIMRKMREISPFQAPGSWADMDMLYVGVGKLNTYEEQTHFSFWAALKSPLIIGADLTKINASSVEVLKNKDVIAINQDNLGKAVVYVPELSEENELQTWVGPLSGGRSVALVFNEGNTTINTTLPLENLHSYILESNTTVHSRPRKAKDVWDNKYLQALNGSLSLTIASHQTKVLLLE